MPKRGQFRQFHVNFWQASTVENIDPLEKLLYIYMITSPKSNMEGVYKTTLRRISFETGIDRDMVSKMADRFAKIGIGGIAVDGGDVWVVVSRAPEFMSVSPSIQKHFTENMLGVPPEIMSYMDYAGYRWPAWYEKPQFPQFNGHPVHTLYTPCAHTDTDTDTYTNTDTYTDTNTSPAAFATAEESSVSTTKEPRALSPMKDPIADEYQQAMTAETPAEAWKSIPQERKQLDKLGSLTQQLSRVTGIAASDLVAVVLDEYKTMRRNNRAEYWRAAPYTPSALVTRWDQVIESVKQKHAEPLEVIF